MASFTLRGVDTDLWQQARQKASTEGISIKKAVEALLKVWVATVILMALSASTAHAQPPLLAVGVIGSNLMDVGSSYYAFQNPRIHEAGPLAGGAGLIPVKLMATTSEVLLVRGLWQRNQKKSAIAATVGIVLVNGLIAQHNIALANRTPR